jgi:hypothetical protein
MKVKFEQLKLEKRLRDLESINSMTMRIEDIIKLPDDIPVRAVKDEN